MVRLVTEAFSQQEWTDTVSRFYDLSLMQTWEFAEAKAQTGSWKVERATFLDGECVVGAVQALVRAIPWLGGGLVWINRGPLWRRSESEDSSRLAVMLEKIRHHWVEQKQMYLRIAPPIREGELDLKTLEAAGYRTTDGSTGWASAIVDISKSEEQLRRDLRRKWRGDLNSAERQGVSCVMGRSSDLFEDFISYYETFLSGKGFFTSVTPQLLRRMQELLPDERKMWVFEGRLGHERLGGLLMACYGDTTLALAGSSPNEKGRAVNSGNLVWWQMMLKMKELGYRWLDVGGADPKRTPEGILHFKAGLRGMPYQLVNDFEAHDGGLLSKMIRSRVSRARQALGA